MKPLQHTKLSHSIDLKSLKFNSTAQLKPLTTIFRQDRALKNLEDRIKRLRTMDVLY